MASGQQRVRLRCIVRGAVQGVGFRPFVYRLARSGGLDGWVMNGPEGVVVEVEGDPDAISRFRTALTTQAPPRSHVAGVESSYLDAVGFERFEIRQSDATEAPSTSVLPDIATCGDCLRELFDPGDRRYRYPFINCTNCGPRYSIIESLPYDRPGTVMREFEMCPLCRAEYEDPENRRFHAQPNACPECGPRLELLEPGGTRLAIRDEALSVAVEAILDGRVVALKGVGGFQLVCDARSSQAVSSLRTRKQRGDKPFALMYPDIEALRAHCGVSAWERELLLSPESPIVILDRTIESREGVLAPEVAPGNPCIGAMLPYSPLHHLLMRDLGIPVVATSGNLSEEPICISNPEALERLAGIADLFLAHDRRIARNVDDSVARVVLDRPVILRRARGYAPMPLDLPSSDGPTVLAVGPMLKNTVGLGVGNQAYLSQHVGDLETAASRTAFRDVVEGLTGLYAATPGIVACDLHPDYFSTLFASTSGVPVVRVQHHLAHVLSCMAENHLEPPVLGVSWDGTGYGPDGTVWGGEFLAVGDNDVERVASLRPFPLPGGDAAVREPFRSAMGLLMEMNGGSLDGLPELGCLERLDPAGLDALQKAVAAGINSPRTSSVGRLFDAVASICDLCHVNLFEGQAAMMLEHAIREPARENVLSDRTDPGWQREGAVAGTPLIVDWEPMVHLILTMRLQDTPLEVISRAFHDWLSSAICGVAKRVGVSRVALTGGCFQNRYLTERATMDLEAAGLRPYRHQRVPPNDGGVSLGQLAAVRMGLYRCFSQLPGKGDS
ncbi:carbamoyltransferase HypF [Candidatus Fermentibacterales bacterium]|nr:carbamoyltransferase HypF [Candidatus Fermentibacterales bacterium]